MTSFDFGTKSSRRACAWCVGPGILVVSSALLLVKPSFAAGLPGLQQQIPAAEYAALAALRPNQEGWNDPSAETWGGVTVSGFEYNADTGEILKQGHVTELRLPWSGLSQELPESLGDLVYLQALDFYHNRLRGSIPESIGNLVNLQNLTLRHNNLSGSIPVALVNLVNLAGLDLAENELSESIPATLGNLANLIGLDLSDNNLSGSIPDNLGNLGSLSWLHLERNALSGSIPESLGGLVALTGLYLNSNQLTGSIPDGLRHLVNLQELYLQDNELSGSIPDLSEITPLRPVALFQNCFELSAQDMATIEKMILAGKEVGYAPRTDRCGRPLVLACPSDLRVPKEATETSVSVIYGPASASGGDAPYSIVCSPPSGSTFPGGVSTIQCTATDEALQTATCSFTVTVYDTARPSTVIDFNDIPDGTPVSAGNPYAGIAIIHATTTATYWSDDADGVVSDEVEASVERGEVEVLYPGALSRQRCTIPAR